MGSVRDWQKSPDYGGGISVKNQKMLMAGVSNMVKWSNVRHEPFFGENSSLFVTERMLVPNQILLDIQAR